MPEKENIPSPVGHLNATCPTPCWAHLGIDYSIGANGHFVCANPRLPLQNESNRRPEIAEIAELRRCLVRSPEV